MTTTSPSRQLLLADFPVLEDRLVHEVRQLKAKDPFASIRVLVPTTRMRVHLRRLLTERLGGHLGVDFVMLGEVVHEAGAAPLAGTGERLLPLADTGLGGELLLGQLCRQAAARRDFYFAPIADKPGFHRALLSTLTDLKEGHVSDEQFEHALHHGAVDRNVSAQKLRDVLALWRAYKARLKELGLVDPADLMTSAILALTSTAPRHELTVVYGFYDLNFLQRTLVQVCCGTSRALVLFPRDAGPAFGWTADLAAWFEGQGFLPESQTLAGTSRRAPELRRHAARLFSTPDGRSAPSTGAVTIFSAPTEAREAREIVRLVLDAVKAEDTLRLHEIAVVPRSADTYRQVMQEAFEAAGVPLQVLQPAPLSETTPGRAALLLRDIVAGDYRRSKVMELATSVDLTAEADALPELWDHLTLAAGIVGGKGEWEARLPGLREVATRLWKRGDTDDGEDPSATGVPVEKVVKQTQAFVLAVIRFGEGWRRATNFGQAAECLADFLREWLRASAELEAVIEAVLGLASLSPLVEGHDFSAFGRALEQVLAHTPMPTGQGADEGVVFGDVMALRGTAFRLVFVPGLAEKSFPLPARQDPLLLDYDRKRLNDVLAGIGQGGMLSEKLQRVEEEKLLYRLACGLATERLVLSYSRFEAGTGRQRLPSHFLLRSVEALTGQRATLESLEGYPAYHRVPLSEFAPPELTRVVDLTEYDLGQALRAVGAGDASALSYLSQLSLHFRRGVVAERARWGQRQFTAWEGMLTDSEARELLAQRHALELAPVSPSALETLGSCPYRYLLAYIFRLQALEDPEELLSLSALDRGALVHGILSRFTQSERADETWPPTQAEQRLRQVIREECQGFEKRGVTGLTLFWQLEQERLEDELLEWLRLECEEAGDWHPERVEAKYGYSESAAPPPELKLDETRALQFVGRIDRLDVNSQGQARVIDYKTGSCYFKQTDRFRGGTALQLPLYVLGARQLLSQGGHSAEVVAALLWFISRRGKFKRVEFPAADWGETEATLRRVLLTFSDCVRNGTFFPKADAKVCRYCDFALVCGAGKEEVYRRKQSDPQVAALLELSEIP